MTLSFRFIGGCKVDKPVAIQLKNITKTFGSVVANENVDMDVREGEILAILGENGQRENHADE